MMSQEHRTKPYSPENIELLARLHVLSLFAETGYSLHSNSHGDTYDVVLADMPGPEVRTSASEILWYPLSEAIKLLEKYMDDRYINYPLAGDTEIRKEAFWHDKNSGQVFEYPQGQAALAPWLGKQYFASQLAAVEGILLNENVLQDFRFPPVIQYRSAIRCLACDTSVGGTVYSYGGWKWPQGLLHYVIEHNYRPTDAFISFIRGLNVKQIIKTDLSVVNQRKEN